MAQTTSNKPQHPFLTPERLEEYFDRIKLPQPSRETLRNNKKKKDEGVLEDLTKMLQHHAAAIPFTNLSLHYTPEVQPPSTDIEHIFHQIVRRGHGGICHDTNLLFAEVLRFLGFDFYITAIRWNCAVTMASQMALDTMASAFTPWEHTVLIVTLGSEKYTVDAGSGLYKVPFLNRLVHDQPMPGIGARMQRMIYTSVPGFHYEQKWWRLQLRENENESWFDVMCFQEVEWILADISLITLGVWGLYAYMRSSVFCNRLVMENGVPVGCLSIVRNELRQWLHGKNAVIQVFYSEDERIKSLKERFGIELTEAEEQGIVGRDSALGEDNDFYQ